MSMFVKIRNVNPIGDVHVNDPVTGERVVAERGAVVEVTPELAERLLLQVGNWEPVDETKEAAK